MKTLLFFLIVLISTFAFSHEDTVLSVEDGKLVGLPEKYLPGIFDEREKILSIGGRSFKFPACVSKYFLEYDEHSIEVLASWYHDLDLLPPYIGINIEFKERDYSYYLLFNLDTLEPISFEVRTRANDGNYYHEISMQESCIESIRENLEE